MPQEPNSGFGAFLTTELHATHARILGSGESLPPAIESLRPGDIIAFSYQDGQSPLGPGNIVRHVVMVSDFQDDGIPAVYGDNPEYAGIRLDYFFGPGSVYQFDRMDVYHIPTAEETGQDARFYGTGDFYGEGALSVVIYEMGQNYLGWMLNNTDPFDQDMVIGDDTSDLTGCNHYIRGWCTNAGKGIPDPTDEFGTPWTSDDPQHYAYWIRQVVVYATQQGYADYEILNSVWYISDRAAYYDEILAAVGYPEDGPQKPTEIDTQPPAPPSLFTAIPGNRQVTLSWINPQDTDLAGVLIRCRKDGACPFDSQDGELITSLQSAPGTPGVFVHTNLVNGTSYCYAIFAYDEVSNFSATHPSTAETVPSETSGEGEGETPAGCFGGNLSNPLSANPWAHGQADAALFVGVAYFLISFARYRTRSREGRTATILSPETSRQ